MNIANCRQAIPERDPIPKRMGMRITTYDVIVFLRDVRVMHLGVLLLCF